MQATATHASAIPVICHHDRPTPNTDPPFSLDEVVAGRVLGCATPVAEAGVGAANGAADARVAAGTSSGLAAPRVKV